MLHIAPGETQTSEAVFFRTLEHTDRSHELDDTSPCDSGAASDFNSFKRGKFPYPALSFNDGRYGSKYSPSLERLWGVEHLQVTHFAAVIEQEVAVTSRVFRRGYSSPHPRNTSEGEAVSYAFDVGEDRGRDALIDVEGTIDLCGIGLGLADFGFGPGVHGRSDAGERTATPFEYFVQKAAGFLSHTTL